MYEAGFAFGPMRSAIVVAVLGALKINAFPDVVVMKR